MSSIVDAVLRSDNLDLDLAPQGGGDAISSTPNQRSQQRTASRLQDPMSENSLPHEDEGFADDRVVGLRGNLKNRPRDPQKIPIPRVLDQVGAKVQHEFEYFLET
jgi:hypothetical protein